MKKIFLCCSLLLLCCCNNNLNIERLAEEQANKTVREFARNPKSVTVSDVKTIFKTDSTCVLHFTFRGQNGFGGYSRQEIEYIYYLADTNRAYECIIDLKEEGSKYEEFKRSGLNLLPKSDGTHTEEDLIGWIKGGVNIYAIMSGRKITNKEKE